MDLFNLTKFILALVRTDVASAKTSIDQFILTTINKDELSIDMISNLTKHDFIVKHFWNRFMIYLNQAVVYNKVKSFNCLCEVSTWYDPEDLPEKCGLEKVYRLALIAKTKESTDIFNWLKERYNSHYQHLSSSREKGSAESWEEKFWKANLLN